MGILAVSIGLGLASNFSRHKQQNQDVCLKADTGKMNSGNLCHLFFPGGDVIDVELIQVVVATRSGHHFHQLSG